MGVKRSVGPRGPGGPAIRPMSTPVGSRNIHPAQHPMMQHQAASMQVNVCCITIEVALTLQELYLF